MIHGIRLDRSSGEEELPAPGREPQCAMNLFVLLNLSSPNAVMALDLDTPSSADLPGLGPYLTNVGVAHGQLDTKAGRSL
jgi:hypothetical protein